MKPAATLTQERLKSLLSYDKETGVFRWLEKTGSAAKGNVAGANHQGYMRIRIDRRMYLSHRLAFLYMDGAFPEFDVDHINGDRGDCSWNNLRAATRAQNTQNIIRPRSDSKTGVIGVTRNGNGFSARISINNNRIFVGYFKTAEEAGVGYLDAKRSLHEFCTI